jgi:hypothetical protein
VLHCVIFCICWNKKLHVIFLALIDVQKCLILAFHSTEFHLCCLNTACLRMEHLNNCCLCEGFRTHRFQNIYKFCRDKNTCYAMATLSHVIYYTQTDGVSFSFSAIFLFYLAIKCLCYCIQYKNPPHLE